ncbi:S41 family peptidase [Bacillus kwashiorkori]|uniref:S41 family peptidase n=1 Tax=Bacillus kwashiorkori TaxID=1522318 RepID=UPI000784DE65|nr:S41 family peptidase [Bacillus kwashiorkori]
MKKYHLVIAVILSLLIGSAGTYTSMSWFNNQAKKDQPNNFYRPMEKSEVDFTKVKRAYEVIKNGYVEDVDRKQLIDGAVQGMLSTLEDPYSVYMDEEKSVQFNQSLDSSFEGIGAEIGEVEGKIIILSPYKNSPAEKAGLKPYDQILQIDGEDVTNFDLLDVTLKIRGKKGTAVSLVIRREGITSPITIEVIRDMIPIETVYSQLFDSGQDRIGYIEITSFSRDTGKDFSHHLKQLEKKEITGLIIDVRGNPGGLLPTVEEIASQLVTSKKPILQIEQRNGNRESIHSKLKKKKDYPMVVLTDKGSASASEILAAALQEGEGYPVIGENSFGKGTVQQQFDLGDNSHIKLTLLKWLTPDGNWIHGKGIVPDIPIKQADLYHLHPLQIDTALKRDMNNEQVKYAQLILKSIGFEPGRTDGYFSETTEYAVKAFQQEVNLSSNGIIDQVTANAMEEKVKKMMADVKNDRQLQTAIKYLQHQKNE